VIYFDNAASSWPKPAGVGEAMAEAVMEYGANPGRGGHQLSLRASRTIFQTRATLGKIFGIKDPTNIIFFPNATAALNQALKGFRWSKGDHIISTTYEHNSVRRPLEFLHREYGIEVSYIEPDHNGAIDFDLLRKHIRTSTKLMVCTHVSNLTGSILPIKELGAIAKECNISFCVDASQSAGAIPIHVGEMNIDLLAFPGHKGLYGPQGTGGLYISPELDLIPLLHGGTGSQSEAIDQPTVRPDRYESGTVNTPGIAGWKVGLDFVLKTGVDKIWEHEQELTKYALKKLQEIESVTVYGPDIEVDRAPVIPINVQGLDAQECSYILDQHFGIATRAGMHCTPLGHQSIQTIEQGAVRISFGYFNTLEEVDQLIDALREITDSLSK